MSYSNFGLHLYCDSTTNKWSYSWICGFCRENGVDIFDSGGDEDTKEAAKVLAVASIEAHKNSGSCCYRWQQSDIS